MRSPPPLPFNIVGEGEMTLILDLSTSGWGAGGWSQSQKHSSHLPPLAWQLQLAHYAIDWQYFKVTHLVQNPLPELHFAPYTH